LLKREIHNLWTPDQTNAQTIPGQAPEILWFHGGGGTCKPSYKVLSTKQEIGDQGSRPKTYSADTHLSHGALSDLFMLHQ